MRELIERSEANAAVMKALPVIDDPFWHGINRRLIASIVTIRVAAALRALPAVPPAAERLARAADRMATADAVFGKAIKDGTDWKSADRAAADAYKEFTEALAAFRAAPPAAEPAAEPAPCGTCGGSGQVGAPCPDGPKFVGGVLVSCAVMHSRPCPLCRPGGAA